MSAPLQEPAPAPTVAGGPVPQASIIILTYNSRRWLPDLMPSVWATRGNYEVIVADNDSPDGTADWVASNHPRARILRNGGNLGFAGGNNHAARAARAGVLVFLNPDTQVEPDWLVELLKPFQDPGVGMTTAKVLLQARPHQVNSCGLDVHLSGLTLCRGMAQPQEQYTADDEVAAASGAACAIRRELFEMIGGFNENFFLYMEDTALSLDVWLRGGRVVCASRSRVRHDYALRFGPRKVLYQERNRYLLLLETYQWPTLLVLLPTLLLAEVVTWGFVLTRDRPNWTNKFKAYAEVFTHWGAAMAKRRLNQSQRKVSDRALLRRTTHRLDFGQVSPGLASRLAAAVFDPLFRGLRAVTLWLVRW